MFNFLNTCCWWYLISVCLFNNMNYYYNNTFKDGCVPRWVSAHVLFLQQHDDNKQLFPQKTPRKLTSSQQIITLYDSFLQVIGNACVNNQTVCSHRTFIFILITGLLLRTRVRSYGFNRVYKFQWIPGFSSGFSGSLICEFNDFLQNLTRIEIMLTPQLNGHSVTTIAESTA